MFRNVWMDDKMLQMIGEGGWLMVLDGPALACHCHTLSHRHLPTSCISRLKYLKEERTFHKGSHQKNLKIVLKGR